MKQSKAEKLIDKRIDRAYNTTCSGIQIDIMDIGKIFKDGAAFLAEHPEATDYDLGCRVRAFVETIRKN